MFSICTLLTSHAYCGLGSFLAGLCQRESGTGAKKIGVVVALAVVIVIAAVVTAMRIRNAGVPAAASWGPKALSAAKVAMIDKKTFEIFTETAGDWETKCAPDAAGH
jgi:hypothetical protein